MMRYLILDQAGEILNIVNDEPDAGSFVLRDVPDTYPEFSRWDLPTLEFVDKMDVCKADAIASVNHRAEAIRGIYLTPGSGQAMTYLRKEDEARRFDPGGDPADTPFLWAEAQSTGATLAATAALVLAQANAWATLGAAIEGKRRGLVVTIESATTKAELDAIDIVSGWPGQ